MRHNLFIVLLLSLINFSVLAQCDKISQPEFENLTRVKLNKFNFFALDNGLKVVVIENHKSPNIFYQLTVDVDPIFEKEVTGLVSLTGELLKSGTNSISKIEINNTIDSIGCCFYTYQNGMYGYTLTNYKDNFLNIMSDILLNPAFPEKELEITKNEHISELITSDTNLAFVAKRVGQKLRNPNHPYGEITSAESLKKINREHLINYYNRYYKPNTSYLVIVGDITLNEARKDAQRYFGRWQKGEVPKHDYQFPNKNIKPRIALVHLEGSEQSYINITYPVNLKPGDANEIAAILANSIFCGEITSSRLYSSINKDTAYKSLVYSELNKNKLVGNFSVFAQCSSEFTDSIINQLFFEMNSMKKELVDDETLIYHKQELIRNFTQSLEDPKYIAELALNTIRYNLPTDYYHTYPEKINKVTKEQILSVSNKYIDPNQALVVVVGDKSKIKESLKNFCSNGEIELYDTYGITLNEKSQNIIHEEITPKTILEKYFAAIGGIDSLQKIKDYKMVASAKMNGMEIKQKTYRKAPNKYAMTMMMNGNIMMQQVFNGERGIMKNFQGEQELIGKDLENLKINATLNAEMKYEELGIKVTLETIEAIHNKDSYKLKLVNPSGETKYEYYDVESGLKVQSTQFISTLQGEFSQTESYFDYQEVNGIKFPFTIKISGIQNLELQVDSLVINTDSSDDLF